MHQNRKAVWFSEKMLESLLKKNNDESGLGSEMGTLEQ